MLFDQVEGSSAARKKHKRAARVTHVPQKLIKAVIFGFVIH